MGSTRTLMGCVVSIVGALVLVVASVISAAAVAVETLQIISPMPQMSVLYTTLSPSSTQ